MTAVRIAHADPWPGRRPDGRMSVQNVLVVLADDAGHRALPIRLTGDARPLWRLLARPGDRDDGEHPQDHAEEMTGRLLDAAGITVTAVTVTDLGPAVTATRIDIAAPGRTGQVTTRLADGLVLAVITGAPLAVEDPVMDRLAEPVTGPDLLSLFRGRQQPPALPWPRRRSRFEPRNLAFTDELHGWEFGGTFLRQGAGFDYSCAAEDGRVILAAAVPEPAGFAVLGQRIFADDYRDRAVTFRADLRTAGVEHLAGLVLRVNSEGQPTPPRPAGQDPRDDPANHLAFAAGTVDWTRHEVTAQVPPDASLIIFGVFLNGRGQVELRNPQLVPHPAQAEPARTGQGRAPPRAARGARNILDRTATAGQCRKTALPLGVGSGAVPDRELVVLGTASQAPTRRRNHNGYLLLWDDEGLLFDPGEGTQRQMLFAGVTASRITRICITHFHGDHCLGLPGVLARMSLDRVPHPVDACYPAQNQEVLTRLRHAALFRDAVDLRERPAQTAGPVLEGAGFQVEAWPLSHTVPALGYRLVEADGRRMLPDKLAAFGVTGPDIGRLQREGRLSAGERLVTIEQVSEPRRGQRFAFIMDTRLCDAAFELADGADMVVCESTFADTEAGLAREYGHLTAGQAGRIAAESGARLLVLTHFSQRYEHDDSHQLATQAATTFGGPVVLARDLDRIPVPSRRPPAT